MLKSFDPEKTLQASAILAIEHGQIISRLRLLKLLYMADRQSLITIGHSITGDEAVAMKNGPVLSTIYDLIKNRRGTPSLARWSRYFETVGSQNLRLKEDPGMSMLSSFEVETLRALSRKLAGKDDWEIAELTHEFAEWKKNAPQKANKRNDISLDDLLDAIGMSDQKEELLAEARVREGFDRLFSRTS